MSVNPEDRAQHSVSKQRCHRVKVDMRQLLNRGGQHLHVDGSSHQGDVSLISRAGGCHGERCVSVSVGRRMAMPRRAKLNRHAIILQGYSSFRMRRQHWRHSIATACENMDYSEYLTSRNGMCSGRVLGASSAALRAGGRQSEASINSTGFARVKVALPALASAPTRVFVPLAGDSRSRGGIAARHHTGRT